MFRLKLCLGTVITVALYLTGCGEPNAPPRPDDPQTPVSAEASQQLPVSPPAAPSCELTGTQPLSAASKFTGDVGAQAGASLARSTNGTITEVVIGAPGYSSNRGAVYDVKAGVDGFGVSKRVAGEAVSSRAGTSVAVDGVGGLAAGSPAYGNNTGRAYRHAIASLPTNLSGASSRFMGAAVNHFAGQAVAFGQNLIAGTGPQLVLGAPSEKLSGISQIGAVYGFKSPLPALLSTPDFKIRGDTMDVKFGQALAIGDVNNDGVDDLLIGAPYSAYQPVGGGGPVSNAGTVYVFFGPLSGTKNIAQANVVLGGASANQLAGYSLAIIGDADSDGYNDILVGAPGDNNSTGRVYFVSGLTLAGGAAKRDLSGFASFLGETSGDQAGYSVAKAGDSNGEGHPDFLIGAPGCRIAGVPGCSTSTSSSPGAAYLVYGGSTFSGTRSLASAAKYAGEAPGDGAGAAVAGAEDVNGDGNADLLIGAPNAASGKGVVYLVLGQGPQTYYADTDGDGFGDPASTTSGCMTPPAGYVSNPDDCNDNRNDVNPGAVEVCEAGDDSHQVDNNCSGSHDDVWPPKVWAEDEDQDGYGNVTSTVTACAPPELSHWVSYDADPAKADCGPGDDKVHPNAVESCDGKDNDCNAQVDEAPVTFYADADNDGFGSPVRFPPVVAVCTAQPAGFVENHDDCDDTNATINPNTLWYADADLDGFGDASAPSIKQCLKPVGYINNALDCNDTNKDIKDGITWYRDADGDGHGGFSLPLDTVRGCFKPAGYSATLDDCNDNNINVYPGATELCDSVDNNCNGTADEGVTSTFYADFDGDGFGGANLNFTKQACTGSPPLGYSDKNTDCNDFDPSLNPNTLWYEDADRDGYGKAIGSSITHSCSPGAGYSRDHSDCDDTRPNVHPNQVETCEATGPQLDNNCDGNVDDAPAAPYWFKDADGDLYGNPLVRLKACTKPATYVADFTDCNDSRSDVHPGATEVCEFNPDGTPTNPQIDNNCNLDFNDATTAPFYNGDGDNDGYGALTFRIQTCVPPSLRADVVGHYIPDKDLSGNQNPRDCDDTRPFIHPGAPESCNEFDDNCNGQVNEGVVPKWYIDRDGDGCGDASASPILSCSSPICGGPAYVQNNRDLNDNNASICD